MGIPSENETEDREFVDTYKIGTINSSIKVSVFTLLVQKFLACSSSSASEKKTSTA
jgi:hypothetical protein